MDRGFITTGLWRVSRHPNFVCEQAIWVTLYVWACYASWDMGRTDAVVEWRDVARTTVNWTAGGMLGYLALFQGSTPLTEWVSARKYPEYEIYRQRVGRFLPRVWGKGWREDDGEVAKGRKKEL